MKSMTGLVLGLLQGRQVKAVGDLDLGVLQALREGPQGSGGDDVTALDRDDLAGPDRRERDQPAALDPACRALAGLRGDVAGDEHGPVLHSPAAVTDWMCASAATRVVNKA